jgi:hypothetical protein
MKHTTTVSLTVRAMMPGPGTTVELRLGEGRAAHRFVADQEQHDLKITQDLEEGRHTLFLHFKTAPGSRAALQIIGMRIQGVPLFTSLYQGAFHARSNPLNAVEGTLDMNEPGTWRIAVSTPAHINYWGIGFA